LALAFFVFCFVCLFLFGGNPRLFIWRENSSFYLISPNSDLIALREKVRERESEREMGMSDNVKGLILAMASSAFIGTSFILKKKGLKSAGATGTRAGQSIIFL
jgi:hypothetical protein